jgi:rhamnosyltransferase
MIMGEDVMAAACALLSGWEVAYAADATVQHSHDYTLAAEFRRYFDIGVSHRLGQPLLRHFDQPTGEGRRFVVSELAYLSRVAPQQIPEALLRTSLKLVGYKLGRYEELIPHAMKRRLAMHPSFFSTGVRHQLVPYNPNDDLLSRSRAS